MSFDRRSRSIHVDEHEQITDEKTKVGKPAISRRRVASLRLARTRKDRLRPLLRNPIPRRHAPLDDYRLLIVHTHPEYWSRAMYTELKEWVFRRGGRLLYLGGNGLNCEVEFPTPASIIVRNGDKRKQRESNVESRMHDRFESEANLLGVVLYRRRRNDRRSLPRHRSRSLGVPGHGPEKRRLVRNQVAAYALSRRASGHETDKISPSSPKNVVRIAKGTNVDDGGADMLTFDTPGGGRVFSAGSITYVSCLPVDDVLSQITKNLIEKLLE